MEEEKTESFFHLLFYGKNIQNEQYSFVEDIQRKKERENV